MSLQAARKLLTQIESMPDFTRQENIIDAWKEVCSSKLSLFSEIESRRLNECISLDQLRKLFREDLFLLLSSACQRFDMLNKWCFERSKEVQNNPNGHLDMWPRGHYKSTIITFGKSIQDILSTHGDDLDVLPITIGIFSFTRPIAKAFLRQLKLEFERNEILKIIYPDIFYADPKSESFKWSEDEGVVVKRNSNPKESTIEAWGLIEAQPTSKHFGLSVFDDIITKDTARTRYGMEVANASWENALNLSAGGGHRRYAGTRKHMTDTYSLIIKRKAAIPRIYIPYDEDGNGVLRSNEELKELRQSMGEVTWSAEMMQEPLQDSAMGLDVDLLMEHEITNYENLNLYMMCDPAHSKKRNSDYSAFLVLGLDKDDNNFLIDGIRDRLNPSERWKALYKLYTAYPSIINIFYEENAARSDLFNFKQEMNRIGHMFDQKIIGLSASSNKDDRIMLIEPILGARKLYFPKSIRKMGVNGNNYDLVQIIKNEEMSVYPFPEHDDCLDDIGHFIEQKGKGSIISPSIESAIDLDKFYKETALNYGS